MTIEGRNSGIDASRGLRPAGSVKVVDFTLLGRRFQAISATALEQEYRS